MVNSYTDLILSTLGAYLGDLLADKFNPIELPPRNPNPLLNRMSRHSSFLSFRVVMIPGFSLMSHLRTLLHPLQNSVRLGFSYIFRDILCRHLMPHIVWSQIPFLTIYFNSSVIPGIVIFMQSAVMMKKCNLRAAQQSKPPHIRNVNSIFTEPLTLETPPPPCSAWPRRLSAFLCESSFGQPRKE